MLSHIANQLVCAYNVTTKTAWGTGRLAGQKKARNKLARTVCDVLLERLDEEQIQLSHQLFPRGSLKKKCLRRMFAWCGQRRFEGRKFTPKLIESVVRKLMHAVHLQPPPGVSLSDFISSQSARLRKFLAAAKKLEAWLSLKSSDLFAYVCGRSHVCIAGQKTTQEGALIYAKHLHCFHSGIACFFRTRWTTWTRSHGRCASYA